MMKKMYQKISMAALMLIVASQSYAQWKIDQNTIGGPLSTLVSFFQYIVDLFQGPVARGFAFTAMAAAIIMFFVAPKSGGVGLAVKVCFCVAALSAIPLIIGMLG